jgi:hypothetical protein
VEGRLDEVNFWSPKAKTTMKRFRPGEPLFFRLKQPRHCIVGYGFFAHFCVLGLDEAWSMFREKNGDPDYPSFLTRIGQHRKVDLLDPRSPLEPLGCTILRDVMFWPSERWLPWRDEQGWPRNTQRGRAEVDPALASRLLAEIQHDSLEPPAELTERFVPLDVDVRELVLARARLRVGQGTFRSRLLDAYGRR